MDHFARRAPVVVVCIFVGVFACIGALAADMPARYDLRSDVIAHMARFVPPEGVSITQEDSDWAAQRISERERLLASVDSGIRVGWCGLVGAVAMGAALGWLAARRIPTQADTPRHTGGAALPR